MNLLIHNIGELAGILDAGVDRVKGSELDKINSLQNAWLLVEDGMIKDFGTDERPSADNMMDAKGGIILPAFVDSHTHTVFAKPRSGEFVDRIKGLSYEEIARKGGGIYNSALALRGMSEDELFHAAVSRIAEMRAHGTVALEIKSGYGLETEAELKMLRVIKRLKEALELPIKAGFLGAHSIPAEFKDNRTGYIDLVIEEMLPRVAEEGLADHIDVFCEAVAFSAEETDRILEAGAKHGLRPKIHTNQFNSIGGIETAIKHNAISVDHLEVMTDDEIDKLSGTNTIATLLPACPFFLDDPYPEARKMIEKDLTIALATDFNPGSAPSGNMQLVLSLACVKMKMTPIEAINAATINGAAALSISDITGSITKGKRADLILTKKIPSLDYIPYSFGENVVSDTLIKGQTNKQ